MLRSEFISYIEDVDIIMNLNWSTANFICVTCKGKLPWEDVDARTVLQRNNVKVDSFYIFSIVSIII